MARSSNLAKASRSEAPFSLTKRTTSCGFLLLDEIEAAGVTLFGRLEESLRLNVPQTSSTEALQRRQHSDRKRQISFAGVNVLCFGDFWQLDPTGDTSFMSSPKKNFGNPHADRTLTMFLAQSSP